MLKSLNLKKLFLTLILLLVTCTVLLSGCDKKLKEVPFTLNSDSMSLSNSVNLIKSTEEFEIYLGNTSIFEEELSEEFKAVNSQYTDKFFKNNYLVAIIHQATSSMITGYKLGAIEKQGDALYIKLIAIAPNNVTSDMGRYFTYYITVEKDEALTEVKLK